ncbi:MAG: contractile injection system tape measure protein [Bacteroidia bacterium]
MEKTTIDILLDKLPWGISIIQMPWSTEMVFVNW